MTDTMSPEQRRRCMQANKSRDTKPEMVVRKFLHSHGFRYGLHNRKLPGSPDIVLRKYRTVVFVNGCFWHGHNVGDDSGSDAPDRELANSDCCKIPNTNRTFWLRKINRNRKRDSETAAALQAKCWRVITLWECDLKPKLRETTLSLLLAMLRPIRQYDAGSAALPVAAESEAPYLGNGSQEAEPSLS